MLKLPTFVTWLPRQHPRQLPPKQAAGKHFVSFIQVKAPHLPTEIDGEGGTEKGTPQFQTRAGNQMAFWMENMTRITV